MYENLFIERCLSIIVGDDFFYLVEFKGEIFIE